MAIGAVTDVHGNTVALDAVLADAASLGGIDRWYVLGDLVAIGPDPVGVVDRLRSLPDATFVRGNTERYVLHGDDRMGLAWTRAQLGGERLEWLASLPLHARPDPRTLLVHASPGRDDGPGLHPRLADEHFDVLLRGCEADTVVVGHTHRRVDRRVGAVRVVNPGSVGQPTEEDLCAGWVVLDGDRVEHRRVAYDRELVARQTETCGIGDDAVVAILRHLRGERIDRSVLRDDFDALEFEPSREAKRV